MSEVNDSVVDATEQTGNPNPDENGGGSEERKYTQQDVDRIVKDRLAREQKKFAKQSDATKKTSGPEDSDLKGIRSEYEEKLSTVLKRFDSMRSANLKSEVEKALIEAGCIDTEVMSNYFLSRNQVHFDEDDNLVVEGADSLSELVKNELGKRPHLQRPKNAGGTGSKAPGVLKPQPTNLKDMSSEQYAAWKESLNIGVKKSPF